MHPNVHSSIIYSSQDMLNSWMEKENVVCVCVCVYNGILLIHKKKEIMPFAATWMDLEIIILSEVSQTKKDILYDIIYVESKK